MNKKQRDLAEAVAILLSQNIATAQEFFGEVVSKMEAKGFTIECHQKGILGTHLVVAKTGE